jgi:hypothetical protein
MISHGMVFVPLLAISNYIAQRSSIARQEATAAFARHRDEAARAVVQELVRSRRPSFVRRPFGWIAAALCILFAASTIAFLAMREIEAGIGGALLTLLLGWVARDWLANNRRQSG